MLFVLCLVVSWFVMVCVLVLLLGVVCVCASCFLKCVLLFLGLLLCVVFVVRCLGKGNCDVCCCV